MADDSARETRIAASVGVGFKAEHFDAIIESPPGARLLRGPRRELHGRRRPAAPAARGDPRASIRSRCMASACRSARRGRWTAPISPGSPPSPRAISRRSSPNISPGRRTTGAFFNDLLPLPYTEETLGAGLRAYRRRADARSDGTILLENPSTYVAFAETTMGETEFLAEIVRRTGCGLLLDVNNVFVSAANHGFDPRRYLADFPLAAVGEIHLAGYADDTRRRRPAAPDRRAQFARPRRGLGALRRGDPKARPDADPDRMGQRRAGMAGSAGRSAPGRAHHGRSGVANAERADAV